jgi:hypothetical protein
MGTVMLEERVERAIVWLFCLMGGVGVDCALEDEIARRLSGRFAWWKVSEGLRRLQEAGVAVPEGVMVDGCRRRRWRLAQGAWETLAPVDTEDLDLALA